MYKIFPEIKKYDKPNHVIYFDHSDIVLIFRTDTVLQLFINFFNCKTFDHTKKTGLFLKYEFIQAVHMVAQLRTVQPPVRLHVDTLRQALDAHRKPVCLYSL